MGKRNECQQCHRGWEGGLGKLWYSVCTTHKVVIVIDDGLQVDFKWPLQILRWQLNKVINIIDRSRVEIKGNHTKCLIQTRKGKIRSGGKLRTKVTNR